MNTTHFKLVTSGITILGVIMLSAPALLAGQGQPRTPTPRNSTVDLRARDREMRDRSMALDRLEKDDKALAEVVEKLKTDFRRLQTVDNELMREVSTSLSLNYAKIADAVGEMSQCAKRLKANIPVLTNPDVDKGPKIPEDVDETQLKRSLTKLDDAVSDFVKSMSVVEAKNSGKAASDLNSVIQISDSVKRSAQKLSKYAEKR